MDVRDFPSFIQASFGLNLSDMNHFCGESFLLELVSDPLDEAVYCFAPILLNFCQFLISYRRKRRRSERYLVFPRRLLYKVGSLSECSGTEPGQTSSRGAGFGVFGGNRNSDKPKGGSAPPGSILTL